MSVVILSTGYYPDPDIGKPIALGYIYVGTVDLDPEIVANQKTMSVLQEDGSEVAVAQPLRTSAGGVPTYNGSPVTIIAASPYSLKVNDSTGAQKIYSPSNTGSSQPNEDWSEEGAEVAFVDATSFTVAGNVTAIYTVHRAVQLTQTADGTGFVVSSVYAGGPALTTVTVRAATVDSGLATVEYGIEVSASPGGSDEDFHADIVGDLEGNADSATTSAALVGTCAPTTMVATAWPSFSAEDTSPAQTNITGTEKVTVFNNEIWDTNSDFLDNRFTPTVAGKYLIIAQFGWSSVVSGDALSIYINKNAATNKSKTEYCTNTTHISGLSALFEANGTTDYFEVKASNAARDTSSITGSGVDNFFQGSRIG